MSDASPDDAPFIEPTPLLPRKQSMNTGLLRRLADHCLKPKEQAYVAKVQQVLQGDREGKGDALIAKELGMSPRLLLCFRASDRFRIISRYCADGLRAVTGEVDDRERQQRQQQLRSRYDLHAQDALDYVAFAYRRATKSNVKQGIRVGDFADPDRAERMTKQVILSQGWSEPIPTHAKPKDLTPGVIQAQMQAMRAADSREMVVRVTVGDATVEVGTREAQRQIAAEEIGQ